MSKQASEEDLSLPPPLQLQERKKEEARKKETSDQKFKGSDPEGAQATSTPASKFTPSDFSDDDEATLDSEIQELEKSIQETTDQLSVSQKKIRVKEKKEKADRLRKQLEVQRKKLTESQELGEKDLSKAQSKSDTKTEKQGKTKLKSGVQFQDSIINTVTSKEDALKISDLRKSKKLSKIADLKLASLGLSTTSEGSDSSTSSSSSTSSNFDTSSDSSDDDTKSSSKKKKHKRKKHSKSKRSGMTKKKIIR